MKKYYIFTIGCQMNISDSERITAVLENLGYQKTNNESEADLICVVACSVRQSAIDRIYGIARKFNKLRAQSPELKAILTGCVLEKDKKKLDKDFDLIFEISELAKLPNLLAQGSKLKAQSSKLKAQSSKLRAQGYFGISSSYHSPFQAYVPIMTGCNNFCSYCVVPYTRGREISRPTKEIIAEVKNLINKGYKEIILLGQNVNSYRCKIKSQKSKIKNTNQKEKNTDFPELLRKINETPGDFWIRFLTSHPKDMSDELIQTIAKCEKVTEYIHLPVQSGDDEILRRMSRHYTIKDYLNLCSKLKAQCPELSLSTDIIVGFPGETKKQFRNTANLMREVKFDMAYIAQYSPRPGTAAAKLKDDVPKEEKKRREEVLNKILKETALENNKKYIGKEVEVLISQAQSLKLKAWSELSGRTRNFKNIQCFSDSKKFSDSVIGKFIKVKITNCTPWALEGKKINDKNNKQIVIAGPTASGKTELAVEIAKKFDGEIICADSMTVYREMDIGTAKPKKTQSSKVKSQKYLVDGIPHHLIDIVNPDENFSVFDFQKLAKKAISDIQSRGKLPLIVGGTGLFIDSVVYDYKLAPVSPDPILRKKLEKLTRDELFKRINEINPEIISEGDIKNKRRLIRALEIVLNEASRQKIKKKIPKNILYLALDIPRKNLYKKINQRVDEMFKAGLMREFEKLTCKYPLNINAFQSATYKPLVSFWKKEIPLNEAKEKIKQLHRNYAKRQLTWFRKNKDIKWLSFDSAQDLRKQAEKLIKEFLK